MPVPLKICHSEMDEFRAFNFITSYADNGNPRYLWYVRKRKGKGAKERHIKPESPDNLKDKDKTGKPGSKERIEYLANYYQTLLFAHYYCKNAQLTEYDSPFWE